MFAFIFSLFGSKIQLKYIDYFFSNPGAAFWFATHLA